MPSIRICRRSLRRSTDSGKQEEKSVNEQDMKVFGGFGGFRVLFFAPDIRKELSAADSAGVGSTFCFCMKLFRNLDRDFAFKKKSPILPIIYETKRGIKIQNKNYSFFMYKQSKRTPFRV